LTARRGDAKLEGSMPYERDNIQRMHGYTPGEQPSDPSVIKLNTNENPYPPAQAVLEAIRRVSGELLRKYPPPNADRFRDAAARLHGVSRDQIVATNGGDELLRLMVTVFCAPGIRGVTEVAGLGVAEPSYSLYPILAQIQDTPITRIPLEDDWSLPADFADRLNAASCKLAMIVNPHAPSGRLESVATLEAIARKFRGVLLIDEAYVNFSAHDALPLVKPGGPENVLLLRTLSKGYSLAGLRFGYGIGHAKLIEALNKAKDSYPTDVLAQAAAVAALESQTDAKRSWQAVIDERRRLSGALTQRGYRVFPSESNFILTIPPQTGPNAGAIYESLKAGGILVRYFDQDRLRDKLRITIGTPEQDDALLKALDRMAKPQAAVTHA
jgi:histidinol-phosphate aminotransferase